MTNNIITVCDLNSCTGCNACVCICPKDAIVIKDDLLALNAVIDSTKCVNCGLCRGVCQNISSISFSTPIDCFQGWTNDINVRLSSSSGGFVASVANYFLENRMPVYSCSFKNGYFVYKKIENVDDFKSCVGSKYVKSDTGLIFRDILDSLKKDNRVLFIGLPCQVQGLKLYIGEKYLNNLYTIDLICHGTPSGDLYYEYLTERDLDISTISNITFRVKQRYSQVKTNYEYQYWLVPFLNGLTYTNSCYNCKYARYDRVSDLTAGDSWGSDLPKDELSKGVSLILCNTQKGLDLISKLDLCIHAVDRDNAINNNKQLSNPTIIHERRTEFEGLLIKHGYLKAIKTIYRKSILRFSLGKTKIGSFLKKLKRGASSSADIAFKEHVHYD